MTPVSVLRVGVLRMKVTPEKSQGVDLSSAACDVWDAV